MAANNDSIAEGVEDVPPDVASSCAGQSAPVLDLLTLSVRKIYNNPSLIL